jgi:glycosyltransferase involved in cell wall biosynthesis
VHTLPSESTASPFRPTTPHMTRRRPNILVLTPIYPWPGYPPEGIFVHRQIRNLMRLGHRCRVIVVRPAVPGLPRSLVGLSWLRYHPRWMTWPSDVDGVPVDYLFYPQRRTHRGDVVPAMANTVIDFIERHPSHQDADVVYAHWLWTGGAAALALRDRFGWPVAAIARGSEMNVWQSAHPFCRSYVQRVLLEADLPMANCGYLAAAGAELAPAAADRIRVAYNGCDASRFHPAPSRERARAAVSFAPDRSYFVCCATVLERKGMAELAAAWRLFASRRPDWRLVVVGPIVSKRLARQLAAAGRDSITLAGPARPERVLAYLQAADGYVQPSLTEGIANATMEAMAVGVPVVSSDAGGQRELVRDGENGWLVPVHDVRALADAMSSLADGRDRARELGAAGRETVLSQFDPLAHATRLSELLTDLHLGRGAQPEVSSARFPGETRRQA